MMRICVLYNHEYSTHSRVPKQAESLREAGYQVTVICPANPEKPACERINGVEIRRILKRRLYKYHPFSFRLIKYFLKVLGSGLQFDAVHVIDAPMLPLGMLLSRIWRARLVYDASEMWEALFDEEKERLQRNPELSEKKRRQKLTQLAQAKGFERWALSRCDGVLTVNESILEILRSKASGSLKHTAVLRNIPHYRKMPAGNLLREYYQLPEDTRIIVYQGLIAEKRGISSVLEMMTYLDQAVLVLLGPVMPSDQPFFEGLQKRVENSEQLRGRVFYRGFLPQDELLQWTSSADLGLQPILNTSLNHYLCLPNKVFEYIQAGLPIAASDFPELRRLIEDYQIGFVFDPEDPRMMAEHIRRFLNDPERRALYASNARLAKEELNWEKEQLRLIGLYQEILPARG